MNFLDELLTAAKNGDKEAENQLFLKLRARILNLVQYKLRNVRKHAIDVEEDINDVVEETMLTILQKYKITDFKFGFMAWACEIARNKVGDYFRRATRQALKISDLQFVETNPNDSAPFITEGKELEKLIISALRKMKRPCKEVILALLEGNIKEYIAEQKKRMPEGTIYSQIHRCREHLMTLLQEEGYDI